MLSPDVAAESPPQPACPICGQLAAAAPQRAPFGLLVAMARPLIALGAAISFVAMVGSLFGLGWSRFAAGQTWASFATFALAIGVLVLYDIRDSLAQRYTPPQTAVIATRRPVAVPTADLLTAVGRLASVVWLPLQSQRDRDLIGNLTADERHYLLRQLAIVALCIAGTSVAPVLAACFFLSPEAVCIATTFIAANLFIVDWFKKRHRRWLDSTGYARQLALQPPA